MGLAVSRRDWVFWALVPVSCLFPRPCPRGPHPPAPIVYLCGYPRLTAHIWKRINKFCHFSSNLTGLPVPWSRLNQGLMGLRDARARQVGGPCTDPSDARNTRSPLTNGTGTGTQAPRMPRSVGSVASGGSAIVPFPLRCCISQHSIHAKPRLSTALNNLDS